MCGIAGMIRYPASPETRRELVARMGAAIRYRGPDDQGSYVDDDVALGLQRLSVIDLPGGHQPMATDDGRLHIVFNGEIYNFRELRATLRQAGERFRTESDTEVILHQYQCHGLDGFDALNGMFAVAIWDRRSRDLHLVRDRMGVKPLYYFWDGRVLAFASEIKALLELPAVAAEVDPRAIWDYLTFRYVPGPGTVWRHIRKLPPGHRLSISACGGEPRIERWWDMPRPATLVPLSDEEATSSFGDLFADAVRRRMVADVPVGIMLSGGIDSSAVAAVAVESHGHHLKTFSVSFRDSPATDERTWARNVARHLGTDHADIEIGEREFVDFLPDFVRYTDEPMADLASVPLYYVSALARRSVTVALSGEGADEILAGYDFDRWLRSRMSPDGELGDLRADPVPPHMTNYMDSDAKRALFRADVDFPDSMNVVRAHLARAGAQHPLNQILYVYCQDWLVEDLLMKADRMSMANSLELRTPFLDYRLVEWAARAPISAKVGQDPDGAWRTKRVLRTFAERRLPAEIVTRPKQGFPVPVYEWLSGPLRSVAADLVLCADARLAGWFRPAAVRALFDRGSADDAPVHDRHRLWHLMILELWLRAWRQ
jgi:asparagine synthase (glutamine-hydrolysing)